MSRVTDEQIRAANIAYADTGDLPTRDGLLAALEAAERTRAPVSVTNDPRVVALVEAAQSLLKDSLKHSIHEDVYALRAALANLEKKE